MQKAFWFSVITLFCWGVWGIFGKLASAHLGSKMLVLVSSSVGFLTVLTIMLVSGFQPDRNASGLVLATLAGMAGGVGSIFFYLALKNGQASLVVPLTALYPLVTVGLGFWFLKEELSPLNLVGIGLALIAGFLLSL
jgi:transporter family protein